MRGSLPCVLVLACLASCSLGGGGGDATNAELPPCIPSCDGRSCGDDGCGGSCGDCEPGWTCEDGACAPDGTCEPACEGKECGDDGCGGSCGDCPEGKFCNPYLARCAGGCDPACEGRECGDNGCGGSCGSCDADQDCVNHQCVAKANCADGVKNGAETDVDCGGSCPGKCGVDQGCALPKDCSSGICEGGLCKADQSCKDNVKNNDETDADCGGPKCPACAVGKYCATHKDCLSEACIYGVCKEPTCSDGVKNQGEGDIDCGGPCAGCPDGKTCKKDGDCVSKTCAAGVCASCSDGKLNGPETDVDCGGGCKPCFDGKHCKKSSDCTGGGCEGEICCTKNACGTCGPLPKEICNGKDDDCDGQTDESPTDTPGNCPLQKGVCAGTKQACKGASGWVCDASVYKAHAAAYETEEKTCDALDNDCDGATDEGLKNACGKCGAVPKEICNGADDDCNGKIDDLAACGACKAVPEPVEIVKTYSDYDNFQMSWRNFLAMLDDTPYVFLTINGYSTVTSHLYRLKEGTSFDDYKVAANGFGNPYLCAGSGVLRVAVPSYHNYGGYSVQEQAYYELSASGQVLKTEWIGGCSNYSGAPSPIAQGGSTVGVMYWHSTGGPVYATRKSDGTWQFAASVIGGGDYGPQLGIRKNGTAFVATKQGAFEGSVQVQQVGGQTWTLDNGKCDSPALRVGPDDTVWVVYETGASTDYDGTIQVWTLKGSTPSKPESIDSGTTPNLAFDPAGQPSIVYVSGNRTLMLAKRSGSSWKSQTVFQTVGSETIGGYVSMGVDPANRHHIAFTTVTPAEGGNWNSTTHLKYVLFCPAGAAACVPDCSGKQCGDDGCGGSCGTCKAGCTCASGKCQGSGCGTTGCGADPSATCDGACGGKSPSGCWCNSSCANYGDCCPDYKLCCG